MEKTSGVVLAAGFSLRAQGFKMTYPLGGSTVVERCIHSMMAACDETIVVGGYRFEKLEYLTARYPSVRLVINADFANGMFSSVRRGLGVAEVGQAFIAPGDCPLIPRSVYAMMLGVRADIVVPTCNGKPGHPVLLRRPAIQSLLDGRYNTLREFIQSFGYGVAAVDEPGILADMDTPRDYQAILTAMEGSYGLHRDGTSEQRKDNAPV